MSHKTSTPKLAWNPNNCAAPDKEINLQNLQNEHSYFPTDDKKKPFYSTLVNHSMQTIYELPEELQLKIFSYLTSRDLTLSVMPTCKKWCRLSKDPLLWQVLYYKLNWEKYVSSFCTVLKRCSKLSSLILTGSVSTLVEISLCSPAFPYLKELDLGFCKELDPLAISEFVSNCLYIESLNFECCPSVNHDVVCAIAQLKYLKRLNFARCEFLGNASVCKIAKNCLQLQCLNIDGIEWITDSAICELVKHLHSSLLHLHVNGYKLTDKSLKHISQCPQLKSFSILCAYQLTDKSLKYLKTLENLNHLKLCSAENFSEHSLKDFFFENQMRNLTFLEINSSLINDEAISYMVTCCTKLEHLFLKWCTKVTETGLELIVYTLSELITLEILGMYSVTGNCLLDVPSYLPHLRFLSIDKCDDIIDGLPYFLVYAMPQLVVLDHYGKMVVYQPS